MNVNLDLITPLWTADATKKARHVEGTGLAGSLRWWYEALIRGLGGWACDPSEGHCELEVEEFTRRRQRGCEHAGAGRLCLACERQALAACGLCPACQVFGATGWARTFRLAVHDGTQPGYPPAGRGRVRADRRNARGEQPAYYFPPGRVGPLTLTLLPRRPDDTEAIPLLLGLLEFIRRNAALGAKTNLGYGLFKWEEQPANLLSAEAFATLMARRAGVGRRGSTGRWPDLREMFFAEVSLRELWKPVDFANFKYDLRAAFRQGKATRGLRHFLLGTVKDDPNQASKIKMALLPGSRTFRVWGWTPEDLREAAGRMNRATVMGLIHRQVRRAGPISRWREFDSSRDTVRRFTGPEAYLHSLMEG